MRKLVILIVCVAFAGCSTEEEPNPSTNTSPTLSTSAKMNELFTKYHTLISPYVIGPEAVEQVKYTHLTNAAAFTSALETLKQHVNTQNAAATDYLK